MCVRCVSLIYIAGISLGEGEFDLEVEQIDLAVTLSLVLGLPIPRGSLGALILPALGTLSPADRLKAAYVNAQQVLSLVTESVSVVEQRELWMPAFEVFLFHFGRNSSAGA